MVVRRAEQLGGIAGVYIDKNLTGTGFGHIGRVKEIVSTVLYQRPDVPNRPRSTQGFLDARDWCESGSPRIFGNWQAITT